jgi:hypothetical protein
VIVPYPFFRNCGVNHPPRVRRFDLRSRSPIVAAAVSPGNGQMLNGSPANPECKFSTPSPPGVASPDTLESRFGALDFFEGVPDKASTEKIYDNLDCRRASQACLLAPASGGAGAGS